MNRVIASFLIVFVVFVSIMYFTFSARFVSWDFRNNLWGPARLITQGESAYNIKLLFNDSNSIWFPQVIGIFFFLGFLPQNLATNIWLLFNIALLLVLIRYLIQQSDHEKTKLSILGIVALSVFLFPPTIRHLILGQVDILLAVALIAGVHSIERRQFMLGGFLFALALVKPQHCIVVLPSVIVYLLFTKRAVQDIIKILLATCFFTILQTAPLWVNGSIWINDFSSNLRENPNWIQPGIFSILHNSLGTIGFVIWLIIYVTIIVINFQIWSKNKPEKAVLWSLASTAIISPYLWSWDFVLLLPLLIDTTIRLSYAPSRLILFTFYGTSFFGSLFALQGGTASDEVLWWLPFILIPGITSSIAVDKILCNRRFVMHPTDTQITAASTPKGRSAREVEEKGGKEGRNE